MKKIIFFLLVFINFAYGYNYNDLLLKAQASIFPKIMLLDKKIENKLIDGKIVFTIVYDKNDYSTAIEMRKLINEYYKDTLDKYDYKVTLVEFSELSNDTEATAIYALNSDHNIQKVAEIARFKGIIAFAYDIGNLKNGFLLSLMLEKSTVLYLNKENLYTNEVDFVDYFYQIVRFIDIDKS